MQYHVKSRFLFGLRFQVPMCYEDAHGNLGSKITHCMLLPHEVVGTFYRFQHLDLMARLIGSPGDTQLSYWSVFGWVQPSPAKYLAAHRQGIGKVLGRWEAHVLVSESPYLQGHYVRVGRFVLVGFANKKHQSNLDSFSCWHSKKKQTTLSQRRRLTQTMWSRCAYLVMGQRAIATRLIYPSAKHQNHPKSKYETCFFSGYSIWEPISNYDPAWIETWPLPC